MIKFVALIIAAAAIAADIYLYRSAVRRSRSEALRKAFIVWAVLTNAFTWIAMIVVRMSDVGTASMHFSMWVVFAYLITVIPRTLYALFRLVGSFCGAFGRVVRVLGAVVAAAMIAICIWGATSGRKTLKVTEQTLCYRNLPPAFDGFRIVQISDLHVGSLINPETMLKQVVERVNSLDGDLVIQSGDLVNIRCDELDTAVLDILKGIRSRCGVYSVLGNHDLGFYIKDTVSLPLEANVGQVIGAQRSIGWTVLVDTTAIIRCGGDSIALTGLNFPSDLRLNSHNTSLAGADIESAYAGLPDSIFNITVSHAPQMWQQILSLGRGDLTLSGHVHSMQFKMRLFGREVSPAQLMYREWSGLYENDDKYLYINDGIGYVGYPMRIGAYPEITVIELRKCE